MIKGKIVSQVVEYTAPKETKDSEMFERLQKEFKGNKLHPMTFTVDTIGDNKVMIAEIEIGEDFCEMPPVKEPIKKSFIVFSEYETSTLQERVDDLLKKGYDLHGGLSTTREALYRDSEIYDANIIYTQAMLRS